MLGQTIRDLLERSMDFHRQTSEFYQQMEDAAQQPRVRMLLDYMKEHESALARRLSEYEQAASKSTLDAWHKFPTDRATCKCFEGIEVRREMSVSDVVAIAKRLDGCLMNFYRELSQTAASQEIRELFESLLEMEQRDDREYALTARDI